MQVRMHWDQIGVKYVADKNLINRSGTHFQVVGLINDMHESPHFERVISWCITIATSHLGLKHAQCLVLATYVCICIHAHTFWFSSTVHMNVHANEWEFQIWQNRGYVRIQLSRGCDKNRTKHHNNMIIIMYVGRSLFKFNVCFLQHFSRSTGFTDN